MPWWSTSMIFIASVIFIGNDTCYTRRTVKILHASSLISTVQWQAGLEISITTVVLILANTHTTVV